MALNELNIQKTILPVKEVACLPGLSGEVKQSAGLKIHRTRQDECDTLSVRQKRFRPRGRPSCRCLGGESLNSKTKNESQDPPPYTGPHQFSMEAWISCAPFERLLHMEIVQAAGGKAVLKMPFLLDLAQGAGLMHGGALVSLADTAVVMAIKSLLPAETHFATVSMEAKFLHPVKKGWVEARAEISVREGRNLQGRAVLYDEEGRAVMEFSSAFKVARDSRIEGIIFKPSGPSSP